MLLGYSVLSGICVVIATTKLLTKPLKMWQNLLLVCYVSIMALISAKYTGQIIGILMILILLLFIYLMEKEKPMLNVFLACIGYFICLGSNNGLLLLFDRIFGIPTNEIIAKYWLPFSLGYAVFLWGILSILRKVLYSKVRKIFSRSSRTIQYSLALNLMLYIVIFLINIALGEAAGYSSKALIFNTVLFAVCFLVNTKIIFECIKNIEREERKKAAENQQKILENYIDSLEKVIDELRAFRHDYKNIMSMLAGYIRENQIDELREFFYKKTNLSTGNSEMQMEAWKYLKDIQPMELKGFLYEKLIRLLSSNVILKVNISENLNVTYEHMEELIRVVGVFLDNAIEEAEGMTDGTVVLHIIETTKGILFQIENSYKQKPDIAMMNKKGYSTKGTDRGIGLSWVEKTIREHEDMFHELEITEEKVIQKLEVIIGE